MLTSNPAVTPVSAAAYSICHGWKMRVDSACAHAWCEGYMFACGGKPLQISPFGKMVAWPLDNISLAVLEAYVDEESGEAVITRINTPSKFRGHGVASALLLAFLDVVDARGHAVVLNVSPSGGAWLRRARGVVWASRIRMYY